MNAIIGRYNRFMKLVLCVLVAELVASTSSVTAGISPNLSGSAYLSGVNSQSELLHEQSLSQQYSLNWQKDLVPYILARTALIYSDYGVKQNFGATGWRKEFSPSAELLWKHPQFNLGSTAQRRKTSSNDQLTDLTTDFLTTNLRTRMTGYPYLEAQYEQTEVYSSSNRSARDTRERAIIAGSGYSINRSSVSYNFSRRSTENRVDKRSQTDYQHSARLSQTLILGKGVINTGISYRLDYRSQTDRSPATEALPREIPGVVGLYTYDVTPDLGTLDTITTIADGITNVPTSPTIDIGDGNTNWNLGADFGFTRSANRMYIYTDRPSGANVRWDVYKSQDNIVWEQIPLATSAFNVGFSRYEVLFPIDTARYIKVVNVGLNDIASVLVTEVVPLIDIGDQGRIDRHQTTHLVSMSSAVRFSSHLTSTAAVYIRRESGSSLSSIRDETNYSLGVRYQFTSTLHSGLRFERGLTTYKNSTADIDKTAAVSYDLQYRPLSTLGFLLSSASRYSYIRTMRTQELNAVHVRAAGDPLEHLHLATETGWSRNNLYLSGLRYDTWYYSASINGNVLRSLDAILSYLRQRTEDARQSRVRIKSQYSARLTFRPTNAIMVDGSISYVNDYNRRYLVQEYIASWNATPKLSMSGSASFTGLYGGERSDRYSGQLQYNLSRRSAIMVSYSEYDLTPAEGSRSSILQVGLRTSL